MSRLFDSDAENKKSAEVTQDREATRRRAQEAEEALQELADTDAASIRLNETLSKRQSVSAVVYKEYREPGAKWMIEHSVDGLDYILQIHPIRPTKIPWQTVIPMMIGAMDVIFPDTVKIIYVPPSQKYQLQFYTIKIEKITALPGWAGAIERALAGLSAVDAWPAPTPA